MAALAYPYIEIDHAGDATIAGTGTKVLFVAMDRLAFHWDADEIRRQRPHLTLGQIYSALAYYYDHETEINGRIAERSAREEGLLGELGESRARVKVQAARGDR